jgi:hypothetical protein
MDHENVLQIWIKARMISLLTERGEPMHETEIFEIIAAEMQVLGLRSRE